MNTGFLGPAVATVLTACGIETSNYSNVINVYYFIVATVLTACGIETRNIILTHLFQFYFVATVLTACGIETDRLIHVIVILLEGCNSTYRLRY